VIEFLLEYGLFFAKVATFVIAAIIIIVVAVQSNQGAADSSGRLEVKKLNDRFEQMESSLRDVMLEPDAAKKWAKEQKEAQKVKAKEAKRLAKQDSKKGAETGTAESKNIYVLDFDGDMKASAVENFREEISTVLTMASSSDEVVVRLESPGGMVHSYGLASSQLARIKSAGIPLTICVDRVAASGGYMMACIADKILAAPFAVIGSIGVVASLPNFNKVLKKFDVDYELLTAGEYKRTLTMLGENTEAGRKKFIQDLEQTHDLFKDFVSQYRPSLDISAVATGETWYGQKAIENQLVDGLSTSDEYIAQCVKDAAVYEVKFVQKKSWQEKIGMSAQAAIENSLDKVFNKALHDWTTRH
jgi:serine protease SohB